MRFEHKKAILRVVKSPRLARLTHIALITHLLVGGALLAVIFGAATYYVRSNEIAEDVLSTVRREAGVLQIRIQNFAAERKLTLPEAARAVLGEPQPAAQLEQTGRFLSVKIREVDGSTILLWHDPSRLVPVQDGRVPEGNDSSRFFEKSSHEVLRHKGQMYVSIRTPILVGPELVEKELHTTLLMSAAALKRLEREAIGSAFLAAMIVFLATLTIYPAMLLLVRRIEKLSENLLHSNLEMLQVLGSAIAQRDSDTDEHNYRVSLYSVRLAESLNLGAAEMRRLLKGAFLHDVGKIGIPDGILRKPGLLSDDEMKTMREHVQFGLNIIVRSNWLADAAAVVGCHHERVDGKGYPQGISGEEIPLTARIFAIADVFDALCSERPYKKALPAETAIDIMRRESGGHFDQRLFDAFQSMAIDLHTRYANRGADELRYELNAVLSDAFSVRILGQVG